MLSSTAFALIYPGNGSTVMAYSFPHRVLDVADLSVWTGLGDERVLLEPEDYTVTGIGGNDGISLKTLVAVPVDSVIEIRRLVALTQTLDLQSTGRTPSEQLENALDKLTMIAQQQGGVGAPGTRPILYPASEPGDMDTVLPTADQRADRILGFGGFGEQRLYTLTEIASLVSGVWLSLGQLLGEISAEGAESQAQARSNLGLILFNSYRNGLVPKPSPTTPSNYVLSAAGTWVPPSSGFSAPPIPELPPGWIDPGPSYRDEPGPGDPGTGDPVIVIHGINDPAAIGVNGVSFSYLETTGALHTCSGGTTRTPGQEALPYWSPEIVWICPVAPVYVESNNPQPVPYSHYFPGPANDGSHASNYACGYFAYDKDLFLITTCTVTEVGTPGGTAGQTITVNVPGYGSHSGALTVAPTAGPVVDGRRTNVYVLKRWTGSRLGLS